MKTPFAIAVVAIACLLAPAGASAAVTVGGDLDFADGTAVQRECTQSFACTQLQDVADGALVRVPSLGTPLGVVTGWRVRADGGSARVRRLAVEPFGVRSLGAGGEWAELASTTAVQEIAARLPVAEGDAIAIDVMFGTKLWADAAPGAGAFANAAYHWSPDLGDDELRDPNDLDSPFAGDLHYQATIEPDSDGDGLGDETQDGCVACPGGGQPDPPAGPPAAPPSGGDQPPVDADPYAAIRRAGPRVTIAKTAAATKRGAVRIQLDNPHAFKLRGALELRVAGRRHHVRKLALGAGATRTVTIKLARATARKLRRAGKLNATVLAKLRGPVGKPRTTRRVVSVTAPKASRPPAGKPGPKDSGYDGTYKGQDLELVVRDGTVTTFTGSLSLYCTRSGKQKVVRFFQGSGDPAPRIAADGSFAWEATRDYGFVKLKYDGRFVDARTAKGKLVVEDRSPLLGTGRFEFDYCFAGKDWSASR
jgi:hypothetical protein